MKTYLLLVPTDFSPHSDAALRIATSLAKDHLPARIHLVHVQQNMMGSDDEEIGVFEPSRLIATAKLAHTTRDPEVPVETTIVHGAPAEEILTLAAQKQVDVIVMGTHGRTGIAHALIGSVSEQVIRRAPCPVMAVKATLRREPTDEGKSEAAPETPKTAS